MDNSLQSESERDADCAVELGLVLESIRTGDVQAASELHKRFVDRLVRLASTRINRRFRSKIEPEEVVQSVFASFFRRNDNGEFRFDSWNDMWALLVRITICKCTNRVNGFMTAKRNIRREVAGKAHNSTDSSIHAISVEPTPEELAVFNETLDQLFDRIPESFREVVLLRLEGLSNLEISEKIGRTERTVYRWLDGVRETLESLNDEQ